jgi:hypothetical protein
LRRRSAVNERRRVNIREAQRETELFLRKARAAWRVSTRRFPELRFAFLEGGVGWASQLFGDR